MFYITARITSQCSFN